MASFKMRNSRTRKYNSDGSRIYNTFNSTGLVNKYENHNARFDSRNKGRELDLVDSNGNKLNNCSCTIAGCGTQCCRNYFLIQNIKQELWRFSSSSSYGLNNGTVFAPGNIVYTGIVSNPTNNPPLPASSLTEIGVIEDVLFPNANACIPLGPDADQDCSGAFPLNVRLIIRSSGKSCTLQNTFIELPVNKQVTGLFFKPPASIPSTASNSGGLWWHIKETPSVTDSEVTITHESYKVLGSSKVGAPYRAPIAGYRKTLACCCRSNKGNQKCYKGCHGSCYIEFSLPTNIKFQTPMPMRGEYVYLKNGTFFGTVTDFGYSSQGPQLRFSFKNDTECKNKIKQLKNIGENRRIYLYRSDGSLYQQKPFTFNPAPKNDICVSKEATNDIYKDSYAISCQQDTRVCYDKRIRSGMQPKQQFCVDYSKVVGSDGNTYHQKHKRLLCPTDTGWQKPYSFSYSQYNKNRAMNTYERGLERNLRLQDVPGSACPYGSACFGGTKPCCEKSLYRKSGGNSCLNCITPLSCNEQILYFFVNTTTDPTKGGKRLSLFSPGNTILFDGIPIGSVESSVWSILGQIVAMNVKLQNCDNRIQNFNGLQVQKGSTIISDHTAKPLGLTNITTDIKPPKNALTVWKPNNNKFKVQGAVTSGGRLERLKLDTIKAANSKCRKGKRCDINGNGNGPYFAGKPRFTGWMFNGRHREIVCANKYRQQPFGIPQLTNKKRSTRSNPGESNWNPRTKGTYGLYQRSTVTTRAPGCKCPKKTCDTKLCPNGFSMNVLAQDTNRYLLPCPPEEKGSSNPTNDPIPGDDPVIVIPDEPAEPEWIYSGKWKRFARNGNIVIGGYAGYNKYSFSDLTPGPLGGDVFPRHLLPSGAVNLFNPTYNNNEIIYFVPSNVSTPQGAFGGGCQIIVRGTNNTQPNNALLTKLTGDCCVLTGGSWITNILTIGPPTFNVPFPVTNPLTAPEQVTLFTYVSNNPPTPIWDCSPCPYTTAGIPTNQPLPAGQQFTLSLS